MAGIKPEPDAPRAIQRLHVGSHSIDIKVHTCVRCVRIDLHVRILPIADNHTLQNNVLLHSDLTARLTHSADALKCQGCARMHSQQQDADYYDSETSHQYVCSTFNTAGYSFPVASVTDHVTVAVLFIPIKFADACKPM